MKIDELQNLRSENLPDRRFLRTLIQTCKRVGFFLGQSTPEKSIFMT
jgi:hypothetical protein